MRQLLFCSLCSQLKCSEAHRSGPSCFFATPPLSAGKLGGEKGWSWGGCRGRASEMLAAWRRCISLGARPSRQDPERGISEGEEDSEALAATRLLCVWLLSLLRDEEGLRSGLNPALLWAKQQGLGAGPGDGLEVNGQHEVFGSKRLSRVVRVRCAGDWGDAGFPPPHQSSLMAHQPNPGRCMASPGLFISSHLRLFAATALPGTPGPRLPSPPRQR